MAGINFFTGFSRFFTASIKKTGGSFRPVGKEAHSFVFSGIFRKEPGVCP